MVTLRFDPFPAERVESPELASYPRSAYRQRLFCGCPFRAPRIPRYPAHHHRTHDELDHRRQRHEAFTRKGMTHLRTSSTTLLRLAAREASIDLVSPAFGADDLFSFCFHISHKSDFLSPSYPSASTPFSSSFAHNGESLGWIFRTTEKLCWFICT